MSFRQDLLAGKTAVVTGGTQGLGAAIARLFAEAGAAEIERWLMRPEPITMAMVVSAGRGGAFRDWRRADWARMRD